MQIDLRTVTIEPQRKAFDHLVRRFGDKPASRYQEGSYDLQVQENMHYRPTWDPEQELYDKEITKIVMKDWYDLKDPRQFYYSTYTLTRARQQESVEADFKFVESRGLVEMIPDDVRKLALELLLPLRHAAWGANQNNSFICGYGYGSTFTQPCIYHAMDNLGIAQYLSRIGLMLGDKEVLTTAKESWMSAGEWQSLRRYVEDSMAVRDPFESFIAQNLVLDGLLYPLIYEQLVDDYLSQKGGTTVSLLTQFMNDWSKEGCRWVDAMVKTAVSESDANAKVVDQWVSQWADRAISALVPIVQIVLGDQADEAVSDEFQVFKARIKKMGLKG